MRTSNPRFVAAAVFAAIVLAACSSSSKTSTDTTATTEAPTTTAAPTPTAGGQTPTTVTAGGETVGIGDSKFGKILVDSKGMTLYVDEKDEPGNPACTAQCLGSWPPLAAPASPTYATGLDASKYTTVTDANGGKQLAVNGFPLYTWVADKKPGDVTGQDVNGFYVVQTSGEKYDPGAAGGS